jgi:hypothetical protein
MYQHNTGVLVKAERKKERKKDGGYVILTV